MFVLYYSKYDRLCGPVVRVPGFRSRDPGFDFRCYQILWEVVGLERGLLSLVNISDEPLEQKSSGSESRRSRSRAVGICYADHATPSISTKATEFSSFIVQSSQYENINQIISTCVPIMLTSLVGSSVHNVLRNTCSLYKPSHSSTDTWEETSC
jgi:hypothetical protein